MDTPLSTNRSQVSSPLPELSLGAGNSTGSLQMLLRQKTLELEDRNKLLLQARAAIEKMQSELEASKVDDSRHKQSARKIIDEQQSTIQSLQEALRLQDEKEGMRSQEVSSLRHQISELKDQAAQKQMLAEERNVLRQKVTQLEERLRISEQELNESKLHTSDLMRENQVLNNAVTQLKTNVEEKDRMIQDWEVALRRVEGRIQKLEQENHALREMNRTLKREAASRENDLLLAIDVEKRELEARLKKEADARVAQIQEHIKELHDKEASMATQLEEIMAEGKLATERQRAAELESLLEMETTKFTEQIKGKADEVEALQRDMDALKAQHARELEEVQTKAEQHFHREMQDQMQRQMEHQRNLELQLLELVRAKEDSERRLARLQEESRAALTELKAELSEHIAKDGTHMEQYMSLWHGQLMEKLKIIMKKVEAQVVMAQVQPHSKMIRDWTKAIKEIDRLNGSVPLPDKILSRQLISSVPADTMALQHHLSFSLGYAEIREIPEDLEGCRQLIRRTCVEAGVSEASKLSKHVGKLCKLLSAMPKMEKFAEDVLDAARQVEQRRADAGGGKITRLSSIDSPDDALLAIRSWSTEMAQLKDLQDLKKRVTRELRKRAGAPEHSPKDLKSSQVVEEVRDLVLADRAAAMLKSAFKEAELRVKLQPETVINKIVSLFQSLFEVRSLDRVLPRMHDLYLQYNDYMLFTKVLRSMLKLDSHASTTECLSAVRTLIVQKMVGSP